MATPAQTLANRANAQHSTGPKTEGGKAAVAQNSTSHGLSSVGFTLLPHENPEAFVELKRSIEEQWEPETATEYFLVTEMVRAQWRLVRIEAIEAAVLTGAGEAEHDSWAAIARELQSTTGDALMKLDRYAASARRAWHKSVEALLKQRAAADLAAVRHTRVRRNISEAEVNEFLTAPLPGEPPRHNPTPSCETKPLPVHLQRELQAHKRRDPLFDPRLDASQMSKELRKWFEASRATTALDFGI